MMGVDAGLASDRRTVERTALMVLDHLELRAKDLLELAPVLRAEIEALARENGRLRERLGDAGEADRRVDGV